MTFKDTEAREKINALSETVVQLADVVQRLNEALGGALKRIEDLEQANKKPKSHFSR